MGFYRKVVNIKGWKLEKQNNGLDNEEENKVFCEAKTAEYAPDCSNAFIIDHFPSLMKGGPFKTPQEFMILGLGSEKLLKVILLVKYLCIWLNMYKFSDAKITLNKINMENNT